MKRNGEIHYEESKSLYNTLNKCSLSQVRDDISRNILRGRDLDITNNQSSKVKNGRPNTVITGNNRSAPALSIKNYFEPLEDINDDFESSDNGNRVSLSPDRSSVKSDMLGSKNNYIRKPKRRFKSYAQRLSSCELEPISDDSFDLNSATNELKGVNLTVQGKTLPEKKSSNRPSPKPRTSFKNTNIVADSFMNDIKDSFLYELMCKIRTFYKLPKKTGFQWISFLIELFEFVGRYGEEEQ